MANDTKKNTDIHQQIPAQNLIPQVVRQGTKQYTLGMDQTTTNRKSNEEEKVQVDRTHLGNLQKPSPVKPSLGTPGKRRIGRPSYIWQIDTENETNEMGYTQREMEKMAINRQQWQSLGKK